MPSCALIMLTSSCLTCAGDFDSFASLIKATRQRDAERKAQQAIAGNDAVPAANSAISPLATERPAVASDSNTEMDPGTDVNAQPISGSADTDRHSDPAPTAQLHRQRDAPLAEALHPSDAEMLANTSDQSQQQQQQPDRHADTSAPAQQSQTARRQAAQTQRSLSQLAQAQATQSQAAADHSQLHDSTGGLNGRAENGMRRSSQQLAAHPAGIEAQQDSAQANGSNSQHAARSNREDRPNMLSTEQLGRGLPNQQVDLTLNDATDRLSGESLDFDIDEGHDSVQKTDVQHDRALQHLQLLNTKPGLHDDSVKYKQYAVCTANATWKPDVSGVLHGHNFDQHSADALGDMDAVVADSESE